MSSKLQYFGSQVEVQVGDYICYKTLILSRLKRGRVSYIPIKTGRQLAKANKPCDEWLIAFDDGAYTGWIYSPEDLQPNKRLTFIKRADDDFKGMTSTELESLENEL